MGGGYEMKTEIITNLRAGATGIENLSTVPIDITHPTATVFVTQHPIVNSGSTHVIDIVYSIKLIKDFYTNPKRSKLDQNGNVKKFTISLWYTPVAHGWHSMIIGNDGYSIQAYDRYGGVFFGCRINSSIYSYPPDYDYSRRVAPEIGKWYHLAYTYDGKDRMCRLFIDGSRVWEYKLPVNYRVYDFEHLQLNPDSGPHSFRADDVVILNGACLWKENFTPPTKYLLDEYDIDKLEDDEYNSLRIY